MKIKSIKVDAEKSFTYDIEVPDTHDYVLANGLVVHNSTLAAGTTNGIYPIRELSLIKTNETQVNYWVAPDSTKLESHYDIAWNIDTSDMIKFYSIVQKWTDQSISADLYVKVIGDQKISSKEIVQNYLDMVKYGMKTRYYVNSLTSEGVKLDTDVALKTEPLEEENDERGCAGGVCTL